MTLHRDAPTGPKVADFIGPAALPVNIVDVYSFRPTTIVLLEELTTYWVVAESSGVVIASWAATNSDNEDAGRAGGWSIGNASRKRSAASTGSFDQTQAYSFGIRVNGTVNPPLALVRNTRQPSNSTVGLDIDILQSFTTGSNATGYSLSSVELRLKTTADGVSPPTVELLRYADYVNDASIATLYGPTSLEPYTTKSYTFTAYRTVVLEPSTRYVVAVESGSEHLEWEATHSDSEDPIPAVGWTIDDWGVHRTNPPSGDTLLTNVDTLVIRVNGAVNPLLLVSNLGQVQNDIFSLATGRYGILFTTGGHATGYRLVSIDIDTNLAGYGPVGNVPNFELHRVSRPTNIGSHFVNLRPPRIVGPAGILEYTPITSVVLQPNSTYAVISSAFGALSWETTSSNSQDETPETGWSISDHSLLQAEGGAWNAPQTSKARISVRAFPVQAADSAGSGAPAITVPNVLRVPATLGVDLSGIADANGVTNIEAGAAYSWQRFSADGTRLETDRIGTGATYTLTGADAGKTLKVAVRYTDDAGYPAGPLTSPATSPVTAAADCPAPTLTGGAQLIGAARKLAVERAGTNSLFYGFNAASQSGGLDDPVFTTAASNTYEIRVLDNSGSGLLLTLDKDLADADEQTLALHVCDQAYPLHSVSPDGGSSYAFAYPRQDWSGHAERTVHISQDTGHRPADAASLANSAFEVSSTPQGGSQQTLALAGTAPALGTNSLTLTLADAVTDTPAGLTVAYTKPGTGRPTRWRTDSATKPPASPGTWAPRRRGSSRRARRFWAPTP